MGLDLEGRSWGAGAQRVAAGPCPVTLSAQEERSRSEHNLVNIQKTHERMQTENKSESQAWGLGGVGQWRPKRGCPD